MKRENIFRLWQEKEKSFLFITQCRPDETLKTENILHEGDLQRSAPIKDRNGKDIYEGDIVKYERHTLAIPIGIVKYGKFAIYDIDGAFAVYGWYIETIIPKGQDYLDNTCEIIGNTYENPELITNKGIEKIV